MFTVVKSGEGRHGLVAEEIHVRRVVFVPESGKMTGGISRIERIRYQCCKEKQEISFQKGKEPLQLFVNVGNVLDDFRSDDRIEFLLVALIAEGTMDHGLIVRDVITQRYELPGQIPVPGTEIEDSLRLVEYLDVPHDPFGGYPPPVIALLPPPYGIITARLAFAQKPMGEDMPAFGAGKEFPAVLIEEK